MFNFNDNENEEKPKSKTKEAFGQFLKAHWKKLPLVAKLQIIGGVIGVLSLIMIPVLAAIVLNSVNFLFYSDGVQNENKEIDEAYEEYWDQLCKENSKDCTEEQKKAAEKLQKDQAAFYERLDKLTESHLSKNSKDKKEQTYIILTTVFYGYGIDDLTEGTAFELDESGNDEMTVTADEKSNAYVEEKDTLKELVKQFKVSVPKCYYDSVDSDGNATRPGIEIKNGDESFVFNFFDKLSFNLGLYKDEKYEKAQEEQCYKRYNGLNPKTKIEEVNGGEPSVAAFYKYLKTSEYLDKKVHLESIYMNYAKANDLSQDIKSWPEEEKIKVRETIIEDIKDIVEEGMKEEENNNIGISYNNSLYWYPIGSLQTETKNGKLFATGNPYKNDVTSGTGWRENPTGPGNQEHGGVDLAPYARSGVVPVIAAQSGTIHEVSSSISYEEFQPPGTYGNYVVIAHPDGNYTWYGHMYKNTITVKVGEKVEQGQVIGYVGSSGDSTGTHLHFELRVGTNDRSGREDPFTKISKENPRPVNIISDITIDGDLEKLIALINCYEGTTDEVNGMYKVVHGSIDPAGVLTVGHGVTIGKGRNQQYFSKYGINGNAVNEGDWLPKNIVDAVKVDIVMFHLNEVKRKVSDHKLVFDFDKLAALTSFHYNLGYLGETQADGEEDFFHVYAETKDTQALYDNFFQWYRKSDGEIQPGLVTRRKNEFELFHNHVWKCYDRELDYVKKN